MHLQWPDTPEDKKGTDIRAVLLQEYADHGSWARHYSTVRMTVGTFFVTAAIGLVTLRWDNPEWAIAGAAFVVFLIGFVLFGMFTSLTFERMNSQFEIVNSYRDKLKAGHSAIAPVGMWSKTGLPIAVALIVAFVLFDGWWLRYSKQSKAQASRITIPMKVTVGQQPEVTVNVPIRVSVP